MKAVIVSNGNITDYEYIKDMVNDKFVICCDGAINHCINMDINPRIWVGDKDSCILNDKDFERYTANCKVIKLNPQKDMTDTEYAFDVAIQNGFDEITLIGALGSRFDHTIANLYLLKKVSDKVKSVCIVDEKNVIFPIEKHNVIHKGNFKYVSIIPLSEKLCGVTTTGLFYELDNATLEKYTSKGVSNEMTQDVAVIDVDTGDGVIILSGD